jgi:limonene-1,2-epoxide hydrolase
MTAAQDFGAHFTRWGTSFDELCASFRTLLGSQGEWIAGPPPIPPTHGGDEAVGLLEGFRTNYDLATIEVEIIQLAESGGVVYSERIDHLVDSTGTRFISLPVAGIMRLDGAGQIAHWRDYWDMREFLELPRR